MLRRIAAPTLTTAASASMPTEAPPAASAAATLALRRGSALLRLRLLLLWGRRGLRRCARFATSPAAPAAPSAASRLLRSGGLLLLFRTRTLLLLLCALLRLFRPLFPAMLGSLAVAAALAAAPALRAAIGTRRTLGRRRRPAITLPRGSGALFELLNFLVHEAARLGLALHDKGVVTAVRAPSPPFGVRAIAVRTKNAFRQWQNGRIVHFALARNPWTKAAARP